MKTKLIVKKNGEDEPTNGDKPKKKVKLKGGEKEVTKPLYGIYSGIVTEKGSKDKVSEKESILNMLDYMKNNNPLESDRPSNIYRPQFSHIGVNYNKKKADKKLKDV